MDKRATSLELFFDLRFMFAIALVIVLTGSLAALWTVGMVMGLLLATLVLEHVDRRGREPAFT